MAANAGGDGAAAPLSGDVKTPPSNYRTEAWHAQQDANAGAWGRIRTKWRKEYSMGTNSPYMLSIYFMSICYVVYRLFHSYVIPWKQQQALRDMHLTVPMLDSHNAAFGIQRARTTAAEPGTVLGEVDTARPVVITRERLETTKEPTDMIVMQMREFDREKEKDVFIRSVHFLPVAPPVTGVAKPKNLTAARRALSQEDIASEEQAQRARVGESLIHGMVRCAAISPQNNCISNPSQVEQEYVRKMLTALASIHILRHPRYNYVPNRLSEHVEMRQEVLCLGIGGTGSLVSFLNRHMPHFVIDVVEADGAMVRVARNFLGFRTLSGINLSICDPAEFARRSVALDSRKGRYDAVFIDCVDEKGRIPSHLTRLEFLSNLRQSLSDRAVCCVNIPNHDEHHFASVVANWRMAFEGRSCLLLHCRSSPNSVLLTYMDSAGKGIQRFGSHTTYVDYREICKALLSHHAGRLPFDLVEEITRDTFQQVLPGQRFEFRRVNTEEEIMVAKKLARGISAPPPATS